MSAQDCRFKGELATFALGALDPRAEAELSAHVETCKRCGDELTWLAPAIETLPESVERIEPPPALRERLMTIVQAEAEAEAPTAVALGAEAAAGAEAPRAPAWWRPSWDRRRLRIGGFAFGPATALATVLIAAAGLVGYGLSDEGGSPGGARSVPVQASAAGSSARLVIDGGEATFHARGVPSLPPGSVYQVWVQKDGAVKPSSDFRPAADGSAAATVPETLDGADALMVTREPRVGRTVPSSSPVYSATLSN